MMCDRSWARSPTGLEVLGLLLEALAGLKRVPNMLLIDSSVPGSGDHSGPWLLRHLGVHAVGNCCEYAVLAQGD